MKQVSYEEVKATWKELSDSDIYIFNHFNGVTEKLNIEETEGYEIIKGFIEQHKPPTWEKVVNAWENTSDDKLKFTKNDEGIRIEYPNGIYYLINCEQVYSNRKVFSANVNITLYAINSTIRYLENQR